jgi:hypothetical protein
MDMGMAHSPMLMGMVVLQQIKVLSKGKLRSRHLGSGAVFLILAQLNACFPNQLAFLEKSAESRMAGNQYCLAE